MVGYYAGGIGGIIGYLLVGPLLFKGMDQPTAFAIGSLCIFLAVSIFTFLSTRFFLVYLYIKKYAIEPPLVPVRKRRSRKPNVKMQKNDVAPKASGRHESLNSTKTAEPNTQLLNQTQGFLSNDTSKQSELITWLCK
jgi:hypothetical protein